VDRTIREPLDAQRIGTPAQKPVVGSTIVPTLELGMGKVGMNSA
jgi:hypothetical protein